MLAAGFVLRIFLHINNMTNIKTVYSFSKDSTYVSVLCLSHKMVTWLTTVDNYCSNKFVLAEEAVDCFSQSTEYAHARTGNKLHNLQTINRTINSTECTKMVVCYVIKYTSKDN